MPRTLTMLGISTLALMATGASQLQPAPRRYLDLPPNVAGSETKLEIFDAKNGHAIAGAESIAAGTSVLIRAPGYQDVRIATPGGPGATKIPRVRRVALCEIGAQDRDGDGICDAAEQQYHTDAALADTDGDEISDRIEIYGEALSDGSAFSPESYGASPAHRDVFVYMNWVEGWKPKQAALDMVVAAFARSPWMNKDTTTGIDAHFIDGGVIPDHGELPVTEEGLEAIRAMHFEQQYSFPFHYVIFAASLVVHDASGVSPNVPGLNFAVTLGGMEDRTVLGDAGTLMHELGHNLGLKHGGNEDRNFKPNYLSVMNYLYQVYGLQRDPNIKAERVLDYSRFATARVRERRLNETRGFARTTPKTGDDVLTVYNPLYCSSIKLPDENECHKWGFIEGSVPGGLDFDGDGKTTTRRLKADLNGNGAVDTFKGGINDWVALDYTGKPKRGTSRVVEEVLPCPLPHVPTPTAGPVPALSDSAPSNDSDDTSDDSDDSDEPTDDLQGE